ncbi:hypothetical protein [Streptomyces justiciae]|uniref:Uncharacterized protein n=1 Tax=Streptomyces justiciae TaxID=2780140 RepID=A0ABU3M3R5_9ACTN|nr:hypothetical protein [Streptomyces justiciae]MDT7846140.1 hypothetical protein [Streptomyces justiciae]
MSDPPGVTAEAHGRYPDGENPQMAELAERLRQLLSIEGLAHLVLYDGDLAKVVLDADVSGDTDDEGVPLISRFHEQAGRRLYYLLEELEPDFAELRTGALIRTVLRVPSGAIFYYLVEPGLHLYGATSAAHRIDELDELVADCVNDLRAMVNYSLLDYGSYLSLKSETTARPTSWSRSDDPAPEDGDVVSASHPAPGPVIDPLRTALDLDGLHYIAYYAGDVYSADMFHHPALRRYFVATTPQRRRDKYGRMGLLLPGVARRMNASLDAVLEGEVLQIVLDVEQGAVYYHALPGQRYLVGVTLDQSRVAEADQRVARLGRELTDG